MMKEQQHFTVQISTPEGLESLDISHTDETFSFSHKGANAAILNNGDNSWSLVSGNLPQEDINLIGQVIEDYYTQQGY